MGAFGNSPLPSDSNPRCDASRRLTTKYTFETVRQMMTILELRESLISSLQRLATWTTCFHVGDGHRRSSHKEHFASVSAWSSSYLWMCFSVRSGEIANVASKVAFLVEKQLTMSLRRGVYGRMGGHAAAGRRWHTPSCIVCSWLRITPSTAPLL